MSDDAQRLPYHVEETVRAIAELHSDHHEGATRLQRLIERFTAVIGWPAFSLFVTVVIIGWLGWNLFGARHLGLEPFDRPPFPGLECIATIAALYVTLNIVATQRREDELAELRVQLALELAMVNEQKTAKIIRLIEELRRDMPGVENRHDEQAAAMANPHDARIILDAIKTARDAADGSDAPAEGAGKPEKRG